MMPTYSNSHDPYFDDPSTRSPQAFRQPNLQRQNSRPFEGYNTLPSNRFGGENTMPNHRFDSLRDNFNAGAVQNSPLNSVHFPYDMAAAQSWNAGPPAMTSSMHSMGNGVGGMQSMGAFGPVRGLKTTRGRAELGNYFEPPAPSHPGFQMLDRGHSNPMQPRHDSNDADDELIPTAIVIKNIPFAVKKEQLTQLMTDLTLPLPYAFNYHFDNGVFRGLAFANFTSAEETAMVIERLNHFELNGRKLRVEYKKMLPQAERERIEREKRERRGQLEEQHRPLVTHSLQPQLSVSSLSSHIPRTSPSPLSHGSNKPEIDMNDPKNMEFYTKIVLFKNNPQQEVLIFPTTLGPSERRTVHTLAHQNGLMHMSRGDGDQRQVHIFRKAPGANTSPPNPSMTGAFQGNDGFRHNLSRAATTDFNESRQYDFPAFNTLRGQSSVGLLEVDSSGARHDGNLRSAKSFHDLRVVRGPSPVGFPLSLQTNGARMQALNDSANSNTPTLTPSASSSGHGLGAEESFLINGMTGMNLGNGQGTQSSPQRRGRIPFSAWDESQSYQPTAPIGSNRTVSANVDSNTQDRVPIRQSRGPGTERGTGFRRHNGKGSDELRNGPSIITE